MPRVRIPDNVHKLKGTYQPCRHGDFDKKVQVKEPIGEAPEFLTDAGAVIWDDTVKSLDALGLLTGADRIILAQYCMLADELANAGWDFTSAKHSQLRLCAQELGMTPSARCKFSLKDGGDDF